MNPSARLSRRLAAMLCGLLLACGCFAAPELPRLKLSLDWLFTGAHAPLVLAADGGYLARLGLDVQVQRGAGAGDTIRRVAAGEVDVGLADLSSIILHNAQNPNNPVTAFYVVHERAPLAVISLAEQDIRVPADLRGKLIGAPDGEASKTLFPLFALGNGLDPADVRWYTVEPALRETVLVAGRVDAITAYSYAAQYLELQGVRRERIRVMRYADHGVDLYGAAIFARSDFLRRNPETAAALARGINQALLASIAQPAVAVDALRQRMGARTVFEVELQRLRDALEEAVVTPQVRRDGLSVVDPLRLQRQVEQVTGALRLPRVPDVAGIYTNVYLPPREERQVPRPLSGRPEPVCPPLRSAASVPGCR